MKRGTKITLWTTVGMLATLTALGAIGAAVAPPQPVVRVPAATAAPAATSTTSPAADGYAASALAKLPVKPLALARGYSREQFGPRWADTDRNGCDQRNDVLQRDLLGVQLKPGSRCVVIAGVLQDPYTDKRIVFAKAQAAKVQIDHVVALSDAWQTGAATWTAAKREQLATDERLELLAVDGPANLAKGDSDAASWLPLNAGFRCRYVAAQIGVKEAYGLWVTPSEHDKMAQVLATCPGQTAAPTTQAHPEPHAPGPAPPPPAPAPQTTPTKTDTAYPGAFCSEEGAIGHTAKGTSMICRTHDDGRRHWEHA